MHEQEFNSLPIALTLRRLGLHKYEPNFTRKHINCTSQLFKCFSQAPRPAEVTVCCVTGVGGQISHRLSQKEFEIATATHSMRLCKLWGYDLVVAIESLPLPTAESAALVVRQLLPSLVDSDCIDSIVGCFHPNRVTAFQLRACVEDQGAAANPEALLQIICELFS